MPRLSLDQYAISLAQVAALRSEDPWLKVGAVALSEDRRVVSTGYNGLAPGFNADDEFWGDREGIRRKVLLHAEQNALALTKRGEVHTVAVTTCPCEACAKTLLAHGVHRVIYADEYGRDQSAHEIFAFYNVPLIKITPVCTIKLNDP
jgi:dCMP deaminase